MEVALQAVLPGGCLTRSALGCVGLEASLALVRRPEAAIGELAGEDWLAACLQRHLQSSVVCVNQNSIPRHALSVFVVYRTSSSDTN